jgi:hypothetical protein
VLDSDEAVVGLMARHMIHQHHLTLMYWGQGYGGTLEPMIAAAAFRIFGTSVLVLKITSVVLSAVATLVLIPVGARLVGGRAARLAAAAFWVSTANYVWWSTKARGFYWILMILGLLALLVAMRLAKRPERRADWAVLGMIGGLGWWTSPQILHFLVPISVWLVWRLRKAVWPHVVIAAATFLVGSSPWVVWNLRNSLGSLKPTVGPVPYSYTGHLALFFREGIPVALGFIGTRGWYYPALHVVYAALLVGLVVGVIRTRQRSLLLLLILAVYPLIFAIFPLSFAIGEGRYLLFFAPFLWLLIATAARRLPIAGLGLVAILALTVHATGVIADTSVPYAPDVPMPEHTGALIRDLEQHHDTRVWADYWVAYRITFESEEQIIATPLPNEQTRYGPYATEVASSSQPTHVFVQGSHTDADFAAVAAATPGCWDRSRVGRFVVYRRGATAPPPEMCDA